MSMVNLFILQGYLIFTEPEQTHKGDLIAFDAPADIAPNEPKDFYADFDAALFMSLWNGLSDSDGGRGWCEFQTNQIIELLRTLDNASLSVGQPHTLPFPG